MPIDPQVYRQLLERIDRANSFLITATASADGDSIGTQLALQRLLSKLKGNNAEIVVVNQYACPERYLFLPGTELILPMNDKKFGQRRFDIGFVLDGGSERCGNVKPLFDRCVCRVLVDHHRYGSAETYDISLYDPEISSTAEIVYGLFDACRQHVRLDREIAANLYLGMIFDTGLFRFSGTTPRTLRIAAELLETGIDFPSIAAKGMVETRTGGKRLLGEVLKNFKLLSHGELAVGQIPLRLVRKLRAKDDDHETVVENICSVVGVEAAALLLELPGREVKVSLRSRAWLNVGEIARTLGGGGHTHAAGCTLTQTTLDAAVRQVVKRLQTGLRQPRGSNLSAA